jgi:hypothetical protein
MSIKDMIPQNDSKQVSSGPNGPRPSRKGAWNEIAPYAALSLGSFLCGLVMVLLLLWKADILTKLGLVGYFYYLVLLPLGLSAAGFLFGALKSYGRYRGQQLRGTLELGGPVVGALLVILLGFLLPPPATNFALTIYVHGEVGLHDMVLKGSDYVLIDIGSERRREPIGDKSQAFFPEIPASFRGQQVNILLESDSYELVHPGQRPRLDGTSLYLAVRKKAGRIAGRVQNEGGRPLRGVNITAVGLTMITNSEGIFELIIPGDRMKKEVSLQAVSEGYVPWHDNSVVTNANDLIITLRHQP